MEEQLIQKDCKEATYKDIYPITTLEAVKDLSSGESLDTILEQFNHIYLPFKENRKTLTRLQVPNNLRRKGLWITYVSCKDNVITEWYNSDDFSDEEWENNKNWVPYLNKCTIMSLLKDILSWYKA